MTPLEIKNAIISHINSNWATLTPVAWPNKSFSPETEATKGEWMKPSIVMAESDIGELGNDGVGFRNGVVFGNIFINENSSVNRGFELAGAFENMFRRSEDVGAYMIFDEPTTNELGVNPEQKYQFSVTIPFSTFIEEGAVQKPVGSFATPLVTFICSSTGASIFYTTDGTKPNSSSTEYTGAITIATTTAFKAIGIKAGKTSSQILDYGAYL